MTVELEGGRSGGGFRIGIVVARFNKYITSRLLSGAMESLFENGVKTSDVTVAWVPGSFELPVVAKKMASLGRVDAVICLGVVIRGDTDHYRHISEVVARGISNAALDTGVPVIFGVLTTDTADQAIERSGGQSMDGVDRPRMEGKGLLDDDIASNGHGNSGYNAADAAVEMVNLIRKLSN